MRETFTVVATQNDQTHMHFKPQLRANFHTGFGFEDCKDSEKYAAVFLHRPSLVLNFIFCPYINGA